MDPRQAASPSPENQLFYYCSFPKGNGLPQEKVVHLVSQVNDWPRLLAKAAFHRLQPRLYLFLKRHDAPSFLLPEDWKKIESAYHGAQAYTLSLEAELLSVILPRLNEGGIDPLLLKGAALIHTVYRDRPVRFFVDLDLLIHPNDLGSAKQILGDLGYQSQLGHLPSRWHEEEVYSRIPRAYFPFFHPERKISVDLHIDPFEAPEPFKLPSEWLWEEALPLSLEAGRAFLPEPTRLFLHLLFHLAKHVESQQNVWGWYLDLDECLRYFSREIDGSLCRQVIEGQPRRKRLTEILAFLKQSLTSPLPRELDSLEPFTVSEEPRKTAFFFYWRGIPSFTKRLWFIVRWLFPDSEYLQAKYAFRTLGEKAQAYVKHFFTTLLKGIRLWLDGFRRETSRPVIKKSLT